MLVRALKVLRFTERDETCTKPPRQPLISRAVEGCAYGRAGAKWQPMNRARCSTDVRPAPSECTTQQEENDLFSPKSRRLPCLASPVRTARLACGRRCISGRAAE